MASFQSSVTLDHINSFFDLNQEIVPLHITPSNTSSLSINSLSQCSPPESTRPRIIRGTDYVKEERQKERLEQERNLRSSYVPHGIPRGPRGLGSLEELSTVLSEIPNCDELSADHMEHIQSTYYGKTTNYNPNLPITSYREQILQLVNISQVVIIQGSTGCGKTTQVPQYILDDCTERGQNCNIIVTQPRKIAAVSIARRVCNERKWKLGTIVGYKVGLENATSEDTKLTYVTTGVLLQKLINERQITKYTHIVIDEVHERDQDTDFVLLVVKKLIMSNSQHVKVILMSATIDTSLFANYFSLTRRADPAPVIEIQGKVNAVEEFYIGELSALQLPIPKFDKASPCIPNELYDLTVKLMFVFDKLDRSVSANTPDEEGLNIYRGAVLIFLPGYDEIATMTAKLRPVAVSRKFIIIPLHSSITMEEQARVFEQPPPTFRKVIISTNIAESSITVPDVKYVVDFCLTKNLVCDPDTNYTSLRLEWASKSNCTQRKGRAGRVSMGRAYRLVPRAFYEKEIPEYGIPEIMRTSLTQLVLHVKKLNFGEPKRLLALAIDPPEMYGIQHAIVMLKEVGALTPTVNGELSTDDGDLTFIGRVMARLPLDVRISKLIILGHVFGCLEECIIIAASLSLKSFLAKSFHGALEFYKSTLSWSDGTFSDCLALYKAFDMWKRWSVEGRFKRPGSHREEDWGRQNFIQIKRIKEVDLLVKEIMGRLEQLNMLVYPKQHIGKTEDESALETLLLKLVIAGAFFPNFYLQDQMDENEALREINDGDIYSTVYIAGLPLNHGVLYFNALQGMMSVCNPKMSIAFEGRKAYIQFKEIVTASKSEKGTESERRVTPIHSGVYSAVKMRLLNQKLVLQVFKPQEAEKKVEQLRRLQEQLYHGSQSKALHSDRLIVHSTSNNAVKTIDLPPLKQLTLNLFITHIVNCGKFYARYSDQDKNNLSIFIENVINFSGGKNLFPVENDIVNGSLVLAPYPEGKGVIKYFRATVEEITPDYVLVIYIDYGNTKKVKRESLRQIDPDMAPDVYETPALAFECQLSKIKPCAIKSLEWSQEACDWFSAITRKGFLDGKGLHGKIYSVIQNVVRLELFFLTDSGNLCSINQKLIDKGFAEPAEETLLSRNNFDLRSRHQTLMLQDEMIIDPGTFQLTARDLEGADNVMTSSDIAHLKGPYSPLEVSYSGMCFIDHFKSIKIDNDSVNSVTLNWEPQNKDPQLLVASTVSLNKNNNAITLRGTTLMPKIKGLQSILCLVFAPYVEFRVDSERKAYIGAICGLGFDPDTGEALNPDHDVEVNFDTVIDYQDICDVNAIRMGINLILGSESDFAELQKGHLLEMQQRLRLGLLNLVRKKREPKDLSYFPNVYHWNQVDKEHILNAELEESSGDCPHVLPLIKGIILATSLEEDLKKHINLLVRKSDTHFTNQDVYCRLCSVTMNNQRTLVMHLDSAGHKEKELLLRN